MKFVYQIKSPLVLEISGKDAPRYLHNRLSNQIKELPVGRWTFAAALSPQGKTEGFFKVFRLAGESASGDKFIVICDGGDHSEVTAALLRYKVADRVDVKDLSQSAIMLSFAEIDLPSQSLSYPANSSSAQDLPGAISGSIAESLSNILNISITRFDKPLGEFQLSIADEICVLASKTNRLATSFKIAHNKGLIDAPEQDYLLISNNTDSYLKASELLKKLNLNGWNLLSELDQAFLRILGGIPAFPSELNAKTLFSESDLMYAVSFRKGCYVGQEVIEKIDAHGKLAKRLARIMFSDKVDLAEGEVISYNSDKIGRIYSSSYLEDESLRTSAPASTLAFCSIDADITAGTKVQVGTHTGEIF